jgi:von Willebrand factor type A domain
MLAGINLYANTQPLRLNTNPGIVGTNCIEGNAPAEAKGIALTGSLTAPDGFGIRSATLILDGTTTIGTFNASGTMPPSIRLPNPVVSRDLTLGAHRLRINYTFESRTNSAQRLTGNEERNFTVTLKPCLKDKDIVLVYDGSGSIAYSDFDEMRQFGIQLVTGMNVSPTTTNFGVVQFSDGANSEIGLGSNVAAITQTLTTMAKMDGGTDTAAGITTAQSMLSAGRTGAPNVMIVLTDGASNDRPATLAAASAAKAAGTTVIAVGIGSGISREELDLMASNPGFVYTTADYNNLVYVLQALLPARP